MSHPEETRGLLQPSQDAPVSIAVGASVFTYTAPETGAVIVNGGTVSLVEYGRNGTFISTGTPAIFPVSRNDKVRVTYSVTPAMTFVRR